MADIYTKANAQYLLRKKTIWLLGDSNVRATYKDLVWLLQKNSLVSLENLRMKLEKSHMNDVLVKGKKLERGRTYIEERKYYNLECHTTVEFTFLTKCLNDEFEAKLREVRLKRKAAPDVLVMNSCLWDIVRWGPDGVNQYKRNIVELMKVLKTSLPPTTLVIWTTTPPIAAEPSGGFLIKQIEFMKHTIRFEVMEANTFVRQEVVAHGFDVLDIHYHLLLQIHRRRPDGIHWDTDSVRHITNLILTHIALSWGQPLPGNFKSPIVEKMKSFVPEPLDQSIKELNKLGKFLKPNESKKSKSSFNERRNDNSNFRGRGRNRRNKQSRLNDIQNSSVDNDDNFSIWDSENPGNSMSVNSNSMSANSNSMNPPSLMSSNINPPSISMNPMDNIMNPVSNIMNQMNNSMIPANINMALLNMAMNPMGTDMNAMNNNMNLWNFDNNFQAQAFGLLNNLNNGGNNFNNMNSGNNDNGFNNLGHGYGNNLGSNFNPNLNNRKYDNRKRRNYRPY